MQHSSQLHVVVGSGPVGRAITEHLVSRGEAVRVLTRSGSGLVHAKVERIRADVSDAEALSAAMRGASAVYAAFNPPYTRWPQLFPAMQASVLQAARAAGAVYVSVDNVYGYGPVQAELSETTPQQPTTRKGRTRAAMAAELLAAHRSGQVRTVIVRASDFIGPDVQQSAYAASFMTAALRGRPMQLLGDPDARHSVTFVPDFARALVRAAQTESAWGQVWHAPSAPALTQRQLAQLAAQTAGSAPARVSVMPSVLVRALGLVVPMLREVAEMLYLFEQPLVLNDRKYAAAFGEEATPLASALAQTFEWLRAEEGKTPAGGPRPARV